MTSKLHFRNTKQHWVAAAILAPLLLITVPVTAFALTGYHCTSHQVRTKRC